MEVMEGAVHRLLASLALAAVFVLAASACTSDGETEVADESDTEVVDESDTEAAELLAAAGSRLSGRSVRGDATFAFDLGESGPADTLTSSFESDSEGHVSAVVVLEPGTSSTLPDGGEVEVRYLESGAYVRLAAPAEGGGGTWYTMAPQWRHSWPAGQFFGLEGPVRGLVCLLFPHFVTPMAEDCNPLEDAAAVVKLASGVITQTDQTPLAEEVTRVAFALSLEELFPPVARIRSEITEERPPDDEWSGFLDWLGSDVEAEAWIDSAQNLQRLDLDLSLLLGEPSLEPDSTLEMTLIIDFYDFDATDIVVEAPSSVPDARSPDLAVGNYGSDSVAVPEPSAAEPQSECPTADGSIGPVTDFAGPPAICIDPEARYVATFDTSEGEMRFELHADRTPLTVNNFVVLALSGYYDGTLLFRTDPSIDIIQGGSPHTNSASDPGPGYTITDEPTLDVDPSTGLLIGPYRYQPGQLAMARSAGRDSAGAQFFITTGPDAAQLDSQGTYVVFGSTDDAGLAVAQSILGTGSAQDSVHEDSGSARIAAGQRPRPSFRHPQARSLL